jgi:hypothetical protein
MEEDKVGESVGEGFGGELVMGNGVYRVSSLLETDRNSSPIQSPSLTSVEFE